jgi:hypothetical protein
MKTLLLALISPGKSNGTREGAIRGLAGVGKEAIRKGLVEGGGAKVVAAEWESEGGGQHSTLLDSTIVGITLTFTQWWSHPIIRMPCESFGPNRTCLTLWTLQNPGMRLLFKNFRTRLAAISRPMWFKMLIGRRRSLGCQIHSLRGIRQLHGGFQLIYDGCEE